MNLPAIPERSTISPRSGKWSPARRPPAALPALRRGVHRMPARGLVQPFRHHRRNRQRPRRPAAHQPIIAAKRFRKAALRPAQAAQAGAQLKGGHCEPAKNFASISSDPSPKTTKGTTPFALTADAKRAEILEIEKVSGVLSSHSAIRSGSKFDWRQPRSFAT